MWGRWSVPGESNTGRNKLTQKNVVSPFVYTAVLVCVWHPCDCVRVRGWRRRNGAYLLSPNYGNECTFSPNCTTNKIMWFHNVKTQLQLACGRVFHCLRVCFCRYNSLQMSAWLVFIFRVASAPHAPSASMLCVVFGELFRCVSNTLIPFRINWIRFSCVRPLAIPSFALFARLLSISFVIFFFRSRSHTSAAVQCVVRCCLCFGSMYLRKAPATE